MADDGRPSGSADPVEEPASGDTPSSLTRELRRVEELCRNFYDAFESQNIDRMEALWSHTGHARCIHPGWEPVVGWSEIRQSWIEIFRSMDTIDFEIVDSHFEVSDQLAWANLVIHASMVTEEGETFETMVVATNIFERRGTDWCIVLHHSSHVLDDDDDDDEDDDDDGIDEIDSSQPN
ncbi:MAG: nuclear transport factor 2 family protein [Deltaproteobacteria bacterium]|nr:nuclear transport factor 2 family protein [Deltaproteobacteria bacterium]